MRGPHERNLKMSSSNVRIEKDTFGPVEVPADRLWGAQTQRSRQNFAISEERMPMALIRALVTVKKAAAIVNMENGTLAKEKGEAIVKAADEVLAGKKDALEANLHDGAAVAVARVGDAKLFDAFLKAFKDERDPAFKRRYLVALTAFESPELVKRAVELAFSETVPLQDFASFVSGLLSNPAARDGFWKTLRESWKTIDQKASGAPMIYRRVIEALGGLRERKHLDEVRAHLKANAPEALKAATAQTLERLEQDVALRERALPAVSAWLKAH